MSSAIIILTLHTNEEKNNMQQPKLATSKRKLTLPYYRLSEKKSRQKSCFIDSNRIDIVKVDKAIGERKRV